MSDDVAVLMSVYNGEKYLPEQIESIFNQDYEGNITVVVRDDGSKDLTCEYFGSVKQRYNRHIVLFKEENVGVRKSFLKLIKLAPEAGFYFFSDQDDVWDKDKIRIATEKMQKTERPTMYCSNYRLSDGELNVYKEKAIEGLREFSPLKVIFYNWIPGCCMGFNRAMMELLQQLDLENVMMHDSMALALASVSGTVVYDEEPRITHRIHKSNVVGDGHKKIKHFRWIKEKFLLLKNKEDYDLSEMAAEFLRILDNDKEIKYKDDLILLRDYKKSRAATRRLLRHKDAKDKKFDRTTMSIRCKIFFRLF